MNLFDRIANLTKATLHEALNKLEDPILMTGQYLRNLEEDLEQAKSQLGRTQASVRMLQRQREEAVYQASEQERLALEAIAAGDEIAARRAVEAKLRYTEQADRFAADEEAAKQRITELELQIDAAKEEFERLKKKREELAERARKAAEQKESIRPNFSHGLDTGSAARGFERMEEKISGWEASAAAAGAFPGPYGNPANRSRIDEELQRLQSKVNADSKQE
ncbi:PspA/IM30 family protein [Paenibacillus caui]|uniref:PspA/IM30 family protein n=1 Tax=Paenibacillus caui TaxID=2873927 RepID=UPI001CAA1AA0|nr:PspA/IM30 family protein [Paenibacillus caui]